MKVAVINQAEGGGATEAAREILRWGPEAGLEVSYHPGEEGASEEVLLESLDSFSPDLVHLHCWYGSYPFDLPLRLQDRWPLVITLHDTAVVNQFGEECWECYRSPICLGCPALGPLRRWRPNHRMLSRWRKRRVGRRLRARLVLPSAWMGRRIARSEWSRLDQVIIPYGIDLKAFAPDADHKGRVGAGGPSLLFVGHMYSPRDCRKGLPDLLSCWPAVREALPEAALMVAGRAHLESSPAGVSLLGEVSREELSHLYRSADLLCLPSRGDNLPVAVLEAMASGLPVVATRVGGIPEQVVDGVTGALVPPRNPAALARAIVSLLENAAGRLAMGEEARARAVELFSRERSARLHMKLYEDVLRPGS